MSASPSEMAKVKVLLMHPFDALAGSQRVAADLACAFTEAGLPVDFRLGFGTKGFVSRAPGVRRFLPVDHIPLRKLLYPLWLVAVAPRVLWAALRGELVWANTVHAAPATLLALLLAPRRVVLHIHEVEFPGVFRRLLQFAQGRGATLLCVSDFHQRKLGLAAETLYNGMRVGPIAEASSPGRRLVFVGNTSPEKGLLLFADVAQRLAGSGLEAVAYLPSPERADPAVLARAEQAGVAIRFGITDPAEMFSEGFLVLQCTDPALWTETFSLVAVEAINALVPVACAGAMVMQEVLGDALAFDESCRDPDRIAARVRALLADPQRHAELVHACRVRRQFYSFAKFQTRSLAIVERLTSRT